ncbi:MAG: GNAT family N-acetyltransferase [Defluviitaleaceae bacterium]|nr:GNAT family N-acetyltransferase [Defluviitaleaceae bacterium]MCL2264341.1 GNAT family N-acetyltransferase [Defluviitaleaceae bacterium]
MIIPVSSENVNAWAALCNELWQDDSPAEWLEEWNRGDLPHEFLYIHNSEPVAFISLSLRNDYVEGTDSAPVGYLEGIYVKPQFRKRGIAREMVEFAKKWASAKGCTEFASDCELPNEESHLFHTRIGFTEANRIICFTMDLPRPPANSLQTAAPEPPPTREEPPEFRTAPVVKRFAAFLIDHFIFSFTLIPLYMIFVFSAGGNFTESDAVLSVLIFTAAVLVAYCLRDIVGGRSLGKRLVGIGVRDISDTSAIPSVPRLFLRQILTPLWPLEFLVLIVSNQRQKLGDKMAKTGVYELPKQHANLSPREAYERSKRTERKIIIGAVVVFALFIGGLVFGITSMFRNHPAYHIALDHIRTSEEISDIIGEVESFGFMPMGSIHSSPGRSSAEFTIRVRGENGQVRAFIAMERIGGGDWEILRFSFHEL